MRKAPSTPSPPCASDRQTIVVGFGATVADGQAAQVLEAMGEAGGFPFPCDAGADCGTGDRCDAVTHPCGRRYFLAADGAQLVHAMNTITGGIRQQNPCDVRLDVPVADPSLLSVLVDDVDVQPGSSSWSYVAAAGAVRFEAGSEWCARLMASTDATPVRLEVRLAQRL